MPDLITGGPLLAILQMGAVQCWLAGRMAARAGRAPCAGSAAVRPAAGSQPLSRYDGRTLGWSRIQSQLPSGWRRAISTVALPTWVVEVRARSGP